MKSANNWMDFMIHTGVFPNIVSFRTSGLYDKYGFNDGDIVSSDELWLLLEKNGANVSNKGFHKKFQVEFKSAQILGRVLRKFVIPKITSHKVKIAKIRYDHNQWRAIEIDGQETDYENKVSFEPEIIEVPGEWIEQEIMRYYRECIDGTAINEEVI